MNSCLSGFLSESTSKLTRLALLLVAPEDKHLRFVGAPMEVRDGRLDDMVRDEDGL